MFEVNGQEQVRKDAKDPKSGDKQTQSIKFRNQRWSYLLDACIIVAMGELLFWGVSTQFCNRYNDATRYQCYAIAFWQCEAVIHALGLNTNPKSQCAFLPNSASAPL